MPVRSPFPAFCLALSCACLTASSVEAQDAASQPAAATPAPSATPALAAATDAPAEPSAAAQTTTAPNTPEPLPAPAQAAPVIAEPQAGPTIEMPDDASASTAEAPSDSPAAFTASEAEALTRGLKQQRIDASSATGIGGYAELHYNLENVTGPGDSSAQMDLHRLVIFVAHRFSERARFYSEIEIEHALAAAGKPGEVGVEQGYIDYDLLDQKLGVRAGVVLVPMGVINQWHEPPIFHGVERPTVDRVIIPTTWREGGVGIYGQPIEGLRYELYLMSGLDPSGFSASSGLRSGRGAAASARTDGLAVTGRVEYEPSLGLIAGISGYYSQTGPNADLFDAAGEKLDLDVPVWGVSADVRGRWQGIEARALFASFSIGDTAGLRQARDSDDVSLGLDVGSHIWGAYTDVGYDMLYTLGTEHALLPFVRFSRYDTLASVSGRAETAADKARGVSEWTFGLTYRPITQIAFKADYQVSSPDGATPATGRFNLGAGTMF